MSQPSRSDRGQRDRSDREHRDRRDPRNGRAPSSERSKSSKPPSYTRSTSAPPEYRRDAPREERPTSKWSNVCSRRGIVLMCAALTNLMVLICVVASQAAASGMSSMGGLSSFSINSAYSPFEGTEMQQVRDLDMQYSQMRAPGVYGGVAFSLTMGVLSLLFVVSGTKSLYRSSMKLLVAQFFFQLIGAVLYVVAVGLYIHFVITINATDVCQKRARLYARQGYTWMNCEVQGGDAAVALFGIITTLLYVAGCALVAQAIKAVRRHESERGRPEPGGRANTVPRSRHPQAEALRI